MLSRPLKNGPFTSTSRKCGGTGLSWILRVQNGAEGGGESAFTLSPIMRKRDWKTVALDGAGRACHRALVLEDGQVLPATGVMTMAYETAKGKSHRRDEVVACDGIGTPLPLMPPTRERPQPLEPAQPEELLEYVATAIYAATAQRFDADLEQALRQGRIFRTRFRPRATTHEHSAFLLAKRTGIFLLLGERLEFTACVREAPLPPEDEDDIRDDEFRDGEDAWLRMDTPVSGGSPGHGLNEYDERDPMSFQSWATELGGEDC